MTYLTKLKTLLVEATKLTFDSQYPVSDFHNVHASIEYPVKQQHYPGIWINYEDVQPLRIAGIGHREITDPDSQGRVKPFTRWVYQGYATFTVVALQSLECDRLYDEMIRVLAFGPENDFTIQFRRYIEDNELIACNFDFDEIEVRGSAAAPGTPWGTDEIIYERTINMECRGEFLTDNLTGLLVPLSAIKVTAISDLEPPVEIPVPGNGGWV